MVHFEAECCRTRRAAAIRRMGLEFFRGPATAGSARIRERRGSSRLRDCMRLRRNVVLPRAASSRKGELVLHRSSNSSTRQTDGATSHVPLAARRIGEIGLAEASVVVLPARYVLLHLATALTGYSVKAMQRKIERGDWAEGKVWRRAPDGRVMIDLTGYQKWAESQ
jgi:hypothetical protein